VGNFCKAEATKQLNREGLRPLARYAADGERPRSPWARKEWKSFLDGEAAIEDAIRYVEGNPVKEGKRQQAWAFVEPFRGLDTGVTMYLD
jgi:hypothetical protein